MDTLINITNFCNRLERILNRFDYIPFVSIGSALVRQIEAQCQFWVGVAAAVGGIFGRVTGLSKDIRYLDALTQFGFDQMVQGVANGVRSTIAWFPILGNIACGIWDAIGITIPRIFAVPCMVI